MIFTPLRRKLAIVIPALAAMLAVTAQPALAWGERGHRLVGDIAYANVTPEVKAQIDDLLRNERSLGTPECKATTIGDAATYPDCLHYAGWRWNFTFPWHYQDIEVTKPFDIKEGCSNTICATAQIERRRRELADRSLPAVQRLEALIFLTHIVGDLHQPLHASEHEGDAGGNGVTVTNVPSPYPATPPATGSKPANLHSVWDTVVVERAHDLDHLPPIRMYSANDKAKIAGGEVADWALESWTIARDVVYPQVFGHVVVAGEATPKDVTLSDADLDKDADIAAKRLLQGGLRLARLLDEALAQPAPKG